MLPGSIRNWTKAYNHQELDIYHTRLLYKLGMSFIIDDILNLKKVLLFDHYYCVLFPLYIYLPFFHIYLSCFSVGCHEWHVRMTNMMKQMILLNKLYRESHFKYCVHLCIVLFYSTKHVYSNITSVYRYFYLDIM